MDAGFCFAFAVSALLLGSLAPVTLMLALDAPRPDSPQAHSAHSGYLLFHVLLIAIPILIQVYLNSSLAYGLMKWVGVPYGIAAPGALIGASNFFELAVATAIALYGPGSGAALATVVGVLVEVPVMLSVCAFCNRTRHWFDEESPGTA